LRRSYFGTRRFDDTVVTRGLTMHFRGWSHSLERYFSALSGAGFVIDTLREPVLTVDADHDKRWARYPMFLHLRAIKDRVTAVDPAGV